MADEHARAVEQAFRTQAAAFEDPSLNRAYTTDVDWLFAGLRLDPDHLVLDVAAGTGHAARRLAPSVRAVVALDVTAAMLDAGRSAAAAEGVRNVVFVRGDAAALPFPDGSFDVVVSRFAVHHFAQPEIQLGEMVRCLRQGGQLVVADLVAEPGLADAQDRLERLRDPSHARLLTFEELHGTLAGLGVTLTTRESRAVERPVDPWLRQTAAPAAEITAALRAELDGGPPTGLGPRERDGELWFRQLFCAVTASRA